MSNNNMFYCSFVSIHYIICECGDTFPTEEALKEHLEKDHQNKIERNEYKCATCEKIFATEKACLIHQRVHLNNGNIRTKKVKDSDEERERKQKGFRIKHIICEVCGKRYASNAALRYHQRVHTGERPYHCTLCPKSFTMPLFLQIHLRTHTGEKPYACALCPKAFSNKAALLRHDRVHTGVKPYQCPRCGKSFTQSNSMKLHVKTVHLKMPAPYKSKNRRNKEAMKEASKQAALNIQEQLEEAILKAQSRKVILVDNAIESKRKEHSIHEGKEIVRKTQGKVGNNEIVAFDTQIKEEVQDFEEGEIGEVYEEVYEDGEGLYEEVKIEDAEVMYQDGEEVLYEEVYTFEEVPLE